MVCDTKRAHVKNDNVGLMSKKNSAANDVGFFATDRAAAANPSGKKSERRLSYPNFSESYVLGVFGPSKFAINFEFLYFSHK